MAAHKSPTPVCPYCKSTNITARMVTNSLGSSLVFTCGACGRRFTKSQVGRHP